MAAKTSGQSGYDFEELLRAYFLKAGFFVLRGVPLRFAGDDATDIDIWLYEKPTGTMRRRQAIDAKFKARPKASERILWTKGLQVALGLDGAFVATTDKRASLRVLAKKAGISLIDGTDLDRIRSSKKLGSEGRLTEEQFLTAVRHLDSQRQSKDCLDTLFDVKSAIATDFGPPLVNRSLDAFAFFSHATAVAHAGSPIAETLGRLSFLSAALAAIALDYVSADDPFRAAKERYEAVVNVVRYGASTKEDGTERLRMAAALARKYAANGQATASQITNGFTSELDSIPAEIIADHVAKMTGEYDLFATAKALESACYLGNVPNFDQLPVPVKAFLGALLDYSDVRRAAFAGAWNRSPGYVSSIAAPSTTEGNDLFGETG